VSPRVIDIIAFVTLPLAALLVVGVIGLAFTSLPLALAVGAWVALFGTIGALIAPGKGLSPGVGFVVAGIFGIFGVAYIALLTPKPAEEEDDSLDYEDDVYEDDVLDQLERLGKLRDSGILTIEEFEAKKTELLRRL
jgi:hypothetical protein